MKCIVTGGAGFIGSHLCDQLVAQQHKVLCVDNLITGYKTNIAHLVGNPLFQFLEYDCIKPLPENTHADFIYHLASPASPSKYQLYPIETLLVNSIGTYHLLELAKRTNARFVYASSSEIYGDPLQHPQKETYWGNVNPIGQRSCYDEGKRVGETLVSTYARQFDMDTYIIRIFNTYGPRMDANDGRVVSNFIRQAINKQPLTIYGDGSQTRSLCYISDLVDGIIKITKSNKLVGQAVNLGNDHELTIKKLAQIIVKIAKVSNELSYDTLPKDDPKKRKPDLSKVKKATGWKPKVSLETGLKKTLDYFRYYA